MFSKRSILFLLNDFSLGGANRLLYGFCEWLSKNKDYDLIFASTSKGIMLDDFSKLGKTIVVRFSKPSFFKKAMSRVFASRVKLESFVSTDAKFLLKSNICLIYANTIHNEKLANAILQFIEAPLTIHVHEQPFIMSLYATRESYYHISKAKAYITVSNTSKAGLVSIYGVSDSKITNIPPAVNSLKSLKGEYSEQELRAKLGLSEDSFIVLGAGTPHWIKGIDIFIQVVRKVVQENPSVHFIWIGGSDNNKYLDIQKDDILKMGISKNVHFIPTVKDPLPFFNIADLFFLSSRVDTFPLVVLEAGMCSLPIVCFKSSGGITELIDDTCGSVVDYLDIYQASAEILFYSNNYKQVRKKGIKLKRKVDNNYNHESMCIKLGEFIETYTN